MFSAPEMVMQLPCGCCQVRQVKFLLLHVHLLKAVTARLRRSFYESFVCRLVAQQRPDTMTLESLKVHGLISLGSIVYRVIQDLMLGHNWKIDNKIR